MHLKRPVVAFLTEAAEANSPTWFLRSIAVTDAKTLLLELLAVIPDGAKCAELFAEDGVLELPFLHAVGIPNSPRGSRCGPRIL